MTAMAHSEVQELLGAYALDALDDAEVDIVDVHLRTCPRCRAEVEEFRETAAQLAFGGVSAPPGVWEKIQEALEEAPPKLELARVIPLRASRWQTVGARLTAAAAVVISMIALGVSVIGGSDPASDLDDEIAAAFRDPSAQHVQLVAGDGAAAEVIILPAEGRAYLAKDSLPKLAAGDTYQLWGQQGATKVSLGVLGNDPDRLRLPIGGVYEALAITAEKKPGVVASDNPAVVAGLVSTS
ncbi:MAG: anti-sigma factor [Actinomycetota bacterium]|nr:anti-sigma factor [Actinomycetota bacterium]